MLRLRSKTLAGFLFLVCLALLLSFTATSAQAQEPDDSPPVFLPILTASNLTPRPPYQGNFFVDQELNTTSASIAVDAQGRMHLAFAYYESLINEPPTFGVYVSCAAHCEDSDNWEGVGLGENVKEIQLALTPQGDPRVLLRSAAAGGGYDFFYAACNVNCTQVAGWTVTYLVTNQGLSIHDPNEDDLPQRYFALDPQGRPRFIYNDGVTGHLGTFYRYCDNNCTNAANWNEVLLNRNNGQPPDNVLYRDENYEHPALAFTPEGHPRIAARGTTLEDEAVLFYIACDNQCGNFNSWHTLALFDRGSGVEVTYDIEVDGQGRPRIVFYQGAVLGGQGDRLFYTWCNNNCLNGANWGGRDLGLNTLEGQDPDLELDANGRPRIAYALWTAGGLGYSWCNSQCETAGAVWQHQVVESRNNLDARWPVAYPPHCNGGIWDGVTPSLALDRTGNPRIAYDTTYKARCIYIPITGEWEPTTIFHLIVRSVRVNFFPQP